MDANDQSKPLGDNKPNVCAEAPADQRIQELLAENRRLTYQLNALKNAWRSKARPFRERIRRNTARPSIKAPPSGGAPTWRQLTFKDQARQMEEYSRLLLNSTPMMCTLWDSDGNIIDCNQEAAKIIGLNDKAKVIDHFFERNPERQANGQDTRSEVKRIIETTLETGYQRYQWMSRITTGEPLPLEGTAVRIPWGDSYHVLCYAQDLREIRNQRRLTEEAEERAQLLLEATPMICTLWDEDGNPLDCNQEAINIIGLKDKKEFVHHVFDRAPKYQPTGQSTEGETRRIAKEVIKIGYLRYEWMSNTVAGEPLPLGVTSVRIPWRDGYRIISYCRDLREIKKQRRQRREAEERARLLLDNQPLGASVWDENCNLIDCNQALPRILGAASKADVLNRFHDFHPEFQPDGSTSKNWVDAHIRAALASGYEKFEWIHLTASGEPLPAEITLIRIPWKNKWCVAAYMRDLRETLARREADRRAMLLLDFAPFSAAFWDRDGTIIDCNQACLNMMGATDKADFIDRFYDFSPEYQPNGVPSRVQAIANFQFTHENGYKKVRWMHRAASGEPIPTEVTLFRVPWKDGYCIAAYVNDLREHIARMEAEEYSRTLLDATPIGAILWSMDRKILFLNRATTTLVGLPNQNSLIDDYSTEKFSPPFQPDGRPSTEKFQEIFNQAAETGFAQCEWMHITAAGEEIPVEKTMVRIHKQNGWHIASYNRDLREIKARERQARDEKMFSKTLLDLTPLGIILWNKDGEMIFCNHGLLRLFGFSSLDAHFLQDKYISQLHPPFQPDGRSSTEKLKELFDQAVEIGFAQCEWMHITAAGEELPVEKTLVRIRREDGWYIASYNRDLREIKTRERQAREAAAYSKMLLDVTPLGVILWNRSGQMLFCNQEALRFFGLPSLDSLAYNYMQQWHPRFQPDGSPSAKKLDELISRTFETGLEKCEWIHLNAAGEEFPVEKTLVRIFWQGEWHVASYNRDLRDMKAQEQRRLEAEGRVKILLDATPLGASLWDKNLNMLLCNRATLNLFGFSSEQDYANAYAERTLYPPFQSDGRPSRETLEAMMDKVVQTGFEQFEWMHITAAGEELPVEKTIVRIPWQDTWRIAAYNRDLREIKAHERRRFEAEERVRVILDAVPEGAILLGYDFNIVEYNQTFARMFGINETMPIPPSLLELVIEPQPDGRTPRELAAEVLSTAFETGAIRFECLHCTVSKQPIPTEVTLMRIPWKDDWRLVACIRDLRGAKAREQEILEAQEQVHTLEIMTQAAQIASQAKSEFLAKMSHELRTPLNAVIGFINLELQKEYLPQETVERLDICLDACHNLLHLINDILDISKIEAGQFKLATGGYHLAHLIDHVVSLNVFRIGSKPISFDTKVDPDLPSKLYGDELRIKQILNNLLGNAFKYTSAGTVTLAIGLEPKQATDNNVFIRFSVQDTGQGIDKKNFSSLFTSYSRFDSKTNRLIEGTGLGLAISKSLVEMMGGRIYVESEYGKGSVFSFVIPQVIVDPTPIGRAATMRSPTDMQKAERSRAKRHLRSPRQYASLPHATVLVVDDVPTNQSVAKAMLQRYAMAVDCVASGAEAIELLRSGVNRYNAIFMDHMMPGMNGIEALRHIRALDNDHARAVPVIILTANVISGNKKMFLDQGFQAFLSKPIDPLKLDEIVHTWIKGKPQEDIPPPDEFTASEETKELAAADEAVATVEVEGLDMREAVSRLGSATIFFDVLRSYAVSMPALLERMRRHTEANMEEFAITAHGIKGTSYSVGANSFGDMAKELEEAAANKNWIEAQEQLPDFLEAAEKLLGGINTLLRELTPDAVPEEDKPIKPAPDPEALAALHQASLSCAHSTMEQHLRQLEQCRYQTGGELIAWLRERVDAFDYDLINERLAAYVSS